MKDDGEYRVEVKVRNNLILSAMEAAGYKNVNQLCVAGGFAPTHIGAFVNMKWSPLAADGDLTPTAPQQQSVCATFLACCLKTFGRLSN